MFLSLLLALVFLQEIASCNVYDSNQSACAKDLEEICGVKMNSSFFSWVNLINSFLF
jgi:hypothetical protein